MSRKHIQNELAILLNAARRYGECVGAYEYTDSVSERNELRMEMRQARKKMYRLQVKFRIRLREFTPVKKKEIST